jgi:hypothetical protein
MTSVLGHVGRFFLRPIVRKYQMSNANTGNESTGGSTGSMLAECVPGLSADGAQLRNLGVYRNLLHVYTCEKHAAACAMRNCQMRKSFRHAANGQATGARLVTDAPVAQSVTATRCNTSTRPKFTRLQCVAGISNQLCNTEANIFSRHVLHPASCPAPCAWDFTCTLCMD